MKKIQVEYYNLTRDRFMLAMKDLWQWADFKEEHKILSAMSELEKQAKEENIELTTFNPNDKKQPILFRIAESKIALEEMKAQGLSTLAVEDYLKKLYKTLEEA